ncbi:bifunctional 2-polyprenyl-6-hydroxyphenol methylase/3-demethylubiquinol 3-O-methyltransferase UbiG [Streptomyces sp. WAC06614]|uniref:class I SAM-dependent methyltransferase n=1 Tax=Streptomyces sp. WAC06614 TaxID=2487416 RepID=UPI00163BC7BA|nr:class I SAM-dependent methyltransferase [Streptomyces sp. WAC06614]
MEQAEGRRRYWDRFYRVPQECMPAVSLGEVEMLARRFRPRPGLRAVEVGCGRGSFSASLAALGLVTTGYDWSEVGIQAARWSWRDPRVSFAVHDFLGGRAPAGVTNGSVDVLACRVTLQYLDTAFWSAARRWLRPRTGTAYVVLPVNERQPPEKGECGLPEAVIERLRDDWARSERWHLDSERAFTALLLQGPLR